MPYHGPKCSTLLNKRWGNFTEKKKEKKSSALSTLNITPFENGHYYVPKLQLKRTRNLLKCKKIFQKLFFKKKNLLFFKPPGAEVRAATLDTNSFTVDLIRGPSELGSVYSMIRSLKKKERKNPSIWKSWMEERLIHFWDLLWFERRKCCQSQSIYGQMYFLVFVQYEKVFLLDVIISSV